MIEKPMNPYAAEDFKNAVKEANKDLGTKFVNFSDTTQVARKDSIEPSLFNMKLDANVVISPSMAGCVEHADSTRLRGHG